MEEVGETFGVYLGNQLTDKPLFPACFGRKDKTSIKPIMVVFPEGHINNHINGKI